MKTNCLLINQTPGAWLAPRLQISTGKDFNIYVMLRRYTEHYVFNVVGAKLSYWCCARRRASQALGLGGACDDHCAHPGHEARAREDS